MEAAEAMGRDRARSERNAEASRMAANKMRSGRLCGKQSRGTLISCEDAGSMQEDG